MTKKHFTALADLLVSNRPEINFNWSDSAISCAHNKQEQWESMVQDLASFCESQNSNFDRKKFLDYIDKKLP